MSRYEKRLVYHQFWLFVGWCMVLAVIYFSLNSMGMPVVNTLLHDKLSHVLGYFALMLWFSQLYVSVKARCFIAALFISMGVALEYLQGIGGIRMFEVEDMLANGSGVLLGWLAAYIGLDRILVWFEGRYQLRT